jgi:hypothetical protein
LDGDVKTSLAKSPNVQYIAIYTEITRDEELSIGQKQLGTRHFRTTRGSGETEEEGWRLEERFA